MIQTSRTARARAPLLARFATMCLAVAGLAATGLAAACAAQAPSPPRGVVVTAHRLASAAGAEILAAGGNAIDAAVAVGYAEAVVNPCCGNIGGGGFLVLHGAGGRSTVVNFRETAPAAATADMYLDADGVPEKNASTLGYKAVGVPGTIAGLDYVLRTYGTLPRARVIAPAIQLARAGFILDRNDTDTLDKSEALLRSDPVAAKIFLRPDGGLLRPGDRLVQADLANTLELIAAEGPDAFYRGPIARGVTAASRANGGILTPADFAAYTVGETAPLRCTYRGHVFLAVPPPSSGGTAICEILNILEGYDLGRLGYRSAAATRAMIEAMRYAFTDRNTHLGDPAFVGNPLERLLSKDYAADVRRRIDAGLPPPAPDAAPPEKKETTHYSVADAAGNVVAVTYTINGPFGAGVIAPGTGFFLNNEMDDFTVKPGVPNVFGLVQGTANAIAPGKRPLSSMAPTIVLYGGKPVLVLGSPGGSRIITTTLETAVNVIDHGMTLQEAVNAPRFHYQALPDRVFVEDGALPAAVQKGLEAAGYVFAVDPPWGGAQVIQIGETAVGVSDPRRPAGAAASP